jgi:intein/homing endonuclease
LKSLSKEIGCSPGTIRNFRYSKLESINADALKRLLEFLDIPICHIEKYVISVKRGCSNRAVQIKLPIKVKPELALLMAKSFGDGSILSDWRFNYTNTQLNLVKEVVNAVSTSIGQGEYTLNHRIDRRCYEIKLSPVIGYILYLIGGIKGYKLDQKSKIPNWILKADKKTKSSFLRGIFDDESCVDHSRKNVKRIIIAMGKNQIYEKSIRQFFNQIVELLAGFDISTGSLHVQQRYQDKIVIRLGIYRKSNLENFRRFINFTHVKKRKTLTKMIDSYVDKHVTKKIVLKTLINSKKSLTTLEVAKLNDLKMRTASFHLNNLFREGIVKKIEGKPTFYYL